MKHGKLRAICALHSPGDRLPYRRRLICHIDMDIISNLHTMIAGALADVGESLQWN